MPAVKEGARQRRSLLERSSLPFPNGPPKNISRDMLAAHPPRAIPIPESRPATISPDFTVSPRGAGGILSPRVQWAEGLTGGTPRGTPRGEPSRGWSGSAGRLSTAASPRAPRTSASFGSAPIGSRGSARSAALHTPVPTASAWAELANIVKAPRVTTGGETF
ncbi:hypothetical protein T484DRAFT_1910983 [Baffinella frigidus]|nr:hypothetical protein T484DRAFT_1910983 [Cryptophyta sp. CCMP2293]